MTTSGERRGVAKGEDVRSVLSKHQIAELRAFISAKHEEGTQVSRRMAREWIDENCGHAISNRSIGAPLCRLGCRRRRGRIKVFPLNKIRKARIRWFLITFSRSLPEKEAGDEAIVYMDESFRYQLHGSAYSYFFTDEDRVVQDGIGRISRKGQR